MLQPVLPHSLIHIPIAKKHFSNPIFVPFFKGPYIDLSWIVLVFPMPRLLIILKWSLIDIAVRVFYFSLFDLILEKLSFYNLARLISYFSNTMKCSLLKLTLIFHQIILVRSFSWRSVHLKLTLIFWIILKNNPS